MENKKQTLIKKLHLEETEQGHYTGFYCDGGFYDGLREFLYKLGFETIFYEDWYYEKMALKDENLYFELVEGDLYLYDFNEFETSLNFDDLTDFYENYEEEQKNLNNLNFEEINDFMSLSDDEREILIFLLSENLANDLEDAKDKMCDVAVYEDWGEITEQFIESNFSSVPDSLKYYIDEEKIQRELEINGSFYEYNNKIIEVYY